MKLEELYQNHKDQINALALALNTLNFDANTIAPKDGANYRNKQMSLLSNQLFKLTLDPNYIETMRLLLEQTTDPILKRELEVNLESYDIYKDVPATLQQEFSLAGLNSFETWQNAKQENNYVKFEKDWLPVIKLLKEMTSYFPIKHSYNALLNLYHRGLTQEKLDLFFNTIETRLVPFIQTIVQNQKIKPEFLSRKVPIEKQKEVTQFIRKIFLFDEHKTVISESAHPFSSTFSLNDSRITTRYIEDNFMSNIFSIIHEIGHGTYNLQVNPQFEGTSLADNMSMSMHESQSRFLENMIARHPLFWKPHFITLKELVSPVLDDVSYDEFIFGINYSTPSLIRTEADELTYPLHILIRYKLEMEIIEKENLTNLNEKWNEYYQKYLGLTPSSDTVGILQDVHWSDGSLGYFPTYAYGSAYAAMFFEAMSRDLDVNHLLENGNYAAIKEWNKQNIHQFGGFIKDDEIILNVCQKEFDPNVYCDYLIQKFSKLYHL